MNALNNRLAGIDPNRIIGIESPNPPSPRVGPSLEPNAVAPINTAQILGQTGDLMRQANADALRSIQNRADLNNRSNQATRQALQQNSQGAAQIGSQIASDALNRSGYAPALGAIGNVISEIIGNIQEANEPDYEARYVDAYVRAQNWIVGAGEFEGGGLPKHVNSPEANLTAASNEMYALIQQAGLPPDMAGDLARVYGSSLRGAYTQQLGYVEDAQNAQRDAEVRNITGPMNAAIINAQRYAYDPSSPEFNAARIQVMDRLNQLYELGRQPGYDAAYVAWESGLARQSELLLSVEEDARNESEELSDMAEYLDLSVGVADIRRQGRAEGLTEFAINNQVNDYVLSRLSSDAGGNRVNPNNSLLAPFITDLRADPGDPLSQELARTGQLQEWQDLQVTEAEAQFLSENPDEAYQAAVGEVARNMHYLVRMSDTQVREWLGDLNVNGINVLSGNTNGSVDLAEWVARSRDVRDRVAEFNTLYDPASARVRSEERRFNETISGIRNANSTSSLTEYINSFVESGGEGEQSSFASAWNSLEPEQQRAVWEDASAQYGLPANVPMPPSSVAGSGVLGDDVQSARAQSIALAYAHLYQARQDFENLQPQLENFIGDTRQGLQDMGLDLITVGFLEMPPGIDSDILSDLIDGSEIRQRTLFQETNAAIQQMEEQGARLREITRDGPNVSFGEGVPLARVSGAPTGRPGTVPVPIEEGHNAWISSDVGARWGRRHNGVDVAANEGTPIVSYVGGEVVQSGPNGNFGNSITIRDSVGNQHIFAHMQYDPRIPVGSSIDAGQRIGMVGSTGRSTGPHLHWEIRGPGGEVIHPLNFAGDSAPVGSRSLTSPTNLPASSDVNGIPSGDGEVLQDGLLYDNEGNVKASDFTAEEPYEWDLAPSNQAEYQETNESYNFGYRILEDNQYLRETIYQSSQNLGVPTQWLADWLAVSDFAANGLPIQGPFSQGSGGALYAQLSDMEADLEGESYESSADFFLHAIDPSGNLLNRFRTNPGATGNMHINLYDSSGNGYRVTVRDYLLRVGNSAGRMYDTPYGRSFRESQPVHSEPHRNCRICQDMSNGNQWAPHRGQVLP